MVAIRAEEHEKYSTHFYAFCAFPLGISVSGCTDFDRLHGSGRSVFLLINCVGNQFYHRFSVIGLA